MAQYTWFSIGAHGILWRKHALANCVLVKALIETAVIQGIVDKA